MTKVVRFAAMVLSAGLLVGGCTQQVNMPAAGAAGWRGRNPNTEDTIRFVVIADRTGGHQPGEWERAISEMNLLQPDLVISVGDVIEGYKDNPQEIGGMWREVEGMVSKLNAPYFYCPGNHDMESGNAAEPTKSRDVYLQRHAVQGRSYYSFDYKKAHFVVLDSTWVQKDPIFADEQVAWLREDIARSKNAEQVFVFYHHPSWTNKQYWPTLASILPKGKTTIFNGHTHTIGYQLADGIPTYVLPSTGAEMGDAATNPSVQHMFAYVALNGGKPSIAFVPVGAIKGPAYPQAMAQLRGMMEKSDSIVELPQNGGKVTLRYSNPSGSPITVDCRIASSDWTADPATANVTIPAGGTSEIELAAKPTNKSPAPLKLAERFSTADNVTISRERLIPIYRSTDLGRIASIKVDGNDDEWTNVSPIHMDSANLLFQKATAWKGPADSSCSVRVAVTGDKLAGIINVKDDQIVTYGGMPWEQDGVEFCWDVRTDRNPGMTAGTGQLAMSPAEKDGPAAQVVWIPAGKKADKMPSFIETFTRRGPDGYVIEFAIPVSELGPTPSTLAEDAMRVSVTLSDMDGYGSEAVLKRMSLTGTGDFWRSTAGYAQLTQK